VSGLILSVTENGYGKIIRIESKFIRESGRSAQGVRLLNIEAGTVSRQQW